MSIVKRPAIGGIIIVSAIVAIVLATGGLTTADTPPGVSEYAGGPVGEPLSINLPPVVQGPMTITRGQTEGTAVLSFDDGTCEAGLGVGVPHSALVNFDVPTQCIQGGLDIIGLTTRINSGSGSAFGFSQSGAAPASLTSMSTVGISAIAAMGPCPATGFTTRAIGPSAAVITGTANFFAGVRMGPSGGYIGRDSNGVSAGRMWLNCPTCGMTQYTPTDIVGIGFPGNFMIRLTVEDANCVPVELMEFTIS